MTCIGSSVLSPLAPLPSLLTVDEGPLPPCAELQQAPAPSPDNFAGSLPQAVRDPLTDWTETTDDGFPACREAPVPTTEAEGASVNLYLDFGFSFTGDAGWLDGWQFCPVPAPEANSCSPDPQASYQAGLQAEAAGDFAAASGHFDWAIAGVPDEAVFYFERSYCKARLGDMSAALEDARQALYLDPSNEKFTIQLGALEYVHGDYEAASEHLRRLGELPYCLEVDPQFYLMLAAVELKRGDFVAALAACDEALSQNPNLEAAYLLRGIVQVNQGEFAAAIQDLDRGLGPVPTDVQGLVFRGVAYGNLKMYAQAERDFQLADRLRPGDEQIQALLRQAQGDLSE